MLALESDVPTELGESASHAFAASPRRRSPASAFAPSPPRVDCSLSPSPRRHACRCRPFGPATSFLSGDGNSRGATIALINSIGNLAGFVGPYLVGWIKTETGGFSWALLTLAVGPLATAVIVLRLRHLVK